jgi:hypothetical protein
MSKEKRPYRDREFWEPIVDEYERVRESVTHEEFVERHGVTVGAFHKWLYELRRERESVELESKPAEFVDLDVPSSVLAPLVRVCIGDVAVEFDTLPPPAWIVELAARREGRSC